MKVLAFIGVAALNIGRAFADDIDEIQLGVDLDFDLKSCTYSYSGVQSGSGAVTDPEAPPSQVAKPSGALNMTLNASSIFPGVNILIPCAGTKMSPTQVRWTTDSNPNQTVTVVVNGVPTSLKITRIWGQLIGNSTPEPLFFDSICNQGYNVRLDDTGSDSDTWLNVNSQVNGIPILPINLQIRTIDYIAFGGVPRGTLHAESLAVNAGFPFGTALNNLRNSDNLRVGVLSDEGHSVGELETSTHSAAPNPGSITIRYETSSTRSDITQILDAYNYATLEWDELDIAVATRTDSVRNWPLVNSGGTYIEAGTRAMRARLRWIPQNDLKASDGWTYSTDQLIWISAP